jgi:hypothetical protein
VEVSGPKIVVTDLSILRLFMYVTCYVIVFNPLRFECFCVLNSLETVFFYVFFV